jgi:hypothetical protein
MASSRARCLPARPGRASARDRLRSDRRRRWLTGRNGRALPQVAGLRYHRRAENGGFIAACNDGGALARGEHLVFLNNDTIPQPGWLDALLRTFDDASRKRPRRRARLIFPDGRLQEAGGVVFGAMAAPGTTGAAQSPADCRLQPTCARAITRAARRSHSARVVRANSAVSHHAYAPAYYEDTDLGFACAKRGLRVLVQPDPWWCTTKAAPPAPTSHWAEGRAGAQPGDVRSAVARCARKRIPTAGHQASRPPCCTRARRKC